MSIAVFGDTTPVRVREHVADDRPAVAAVVSDAQLAAHRNETIDAVRAFAAAGIVFVHAAESSTFDRWGNLFRFGVPFFLFASLYFQSISLRRHPERSLRNFIAGRVKRLYWPFIVWSLIYLVSRDVERLALHHLPPVRLKWSMLWTGTEYHLWFLPFLLAWTAALAFAQRFLVQRHPLLRWVVIAATVAAGCYVASRPLPYMPPASELTIDDPAYTYIQWMLAVPATCGALAFAFFMVLGPSIHAVGGALGWGGIALVITCSVEQALGGIELAPRALTGLGAMLAAMVPWKTSAVPILARLGRKGYGIYLCHVFPVEIFHLIFHRCHLPPSATLDVANFALSFVAAWGIVAYLEKSPRLAWLTG